VGLFFTLPSKIGGEIMNENKIVLKKVLSICVVGILYVGFIYGCQGEQSSLANNKHVKIVNDIIRAQQDLTTIPSLSKSFDSMTVEEAYKIQDLLVNELIKKYGPVAGYKIGYADSSALKKNNLNVPAYGPLFKSRIVENGGTVPLKDFLKFSIENEVTFKIGKDIDKIFNTIDDLKSYIESIHLGFDMSEGVFESPSTAQDFIAGGAGSKYFMVGEGQKPDQVNVEDVMITIEFKDNVIYEGSSKNVLGNPWNVMLAVSNDLFKRGKPLKKGDLIFSGKAAPAYKSELEKANGTYTGKGDPFSPVTCQVN
jgi:2-keto-4-pentenoate hydratase